MRRALHYTMAFILVGVLPIPQADARGGGGGGFPGGAGGFRGATGFLAGTRFNGAFRQPGFVRHQRLPFAARVIRSRPFTTNDGIGVPFNGFATGFPNTVPTQFPTGFPWWKNGWGNWSGPVGGWWPGDWGSGGYYGYAYPPQAQAPAPEPQLIVIHTDGNGRMTAAGAPPDYSYVKGCHAIANGYHCDVVTATP